MHRKALATLVLALSFSAVAFPQTSPTEKRPGLSVGIDLVSITYGQILVYLETPISDNLSIDVALGYSPGGRWVSSFSYWYIQTDLRTYFQGPGQNGLYSEFGSAVYFADRKLDFTNWNTTLNYDTSVVVGVVGGVGYKYEVPKTNGAYIDANAFVYGLVPEPIVTTKSEERAVFQYSPFNLLGSVIASCRF